MLRWVVDTDGQAQPDPGAELPGRGAYLCRRQECWEALQKRARKRGPQLTRHAEAFQLAVQGDVVQNVRREMPVPEIGGLLGLARRARSVILGSRETRAALRRGETALVVLAADGSPRDRERLQRICEEEGVACRVVATRETLGSWLGYAPVSVVGLTDRSLAAEVRARLDGSQGKRRLRRPAGTTKAPRPSAMNQSKARGTKGRGGS